MERKHKEEILLLRIRNLIEQNNSLTCGIEETSPDHQQQDTEESAFLAQAIKLVEQNLHVNGYSVEQLSRDLWAGSLIGRYPQKRKCCQSIPEAIKAKRIEDGPTSGTTRIPSL